MSCWSLRNGKSTGRGDREVRWATELPDLRKVTRWSIVDCAEPWDDSLDADSPLTKSAPVLYEDQPLAKRVLELLVTYDWPADAVKALAKVALEVDP